jgi:glycosyltransferase involved in cell wall biosynthesis
MNIVLLTTGPFPYGTAYTNRIISYCKGFVELGHPVKLICMLPTEKDAARQLNKETKGNYLGIDFEYAGGRLLLPHSKPAKIRAALSGLFHSMNMLYRLNRKQKVDALFLGTTRIPYVLVFYLFTRLFRIPMVREKSEYPLVELFPERYNRLYRRLYPRYLYRLFDGMLLITHSLYDYFKERVGKHTRLVVIPMTVEPQRFIDCHASVAEAAPYIAYCGYMWGIKDGVPILIDAFRLIADKHPEEKLYLIGDTSNRAEYDKLKAYIGERGLTARVVFTGTVHRNDMPAYLCNATLLALARPTSLQAQGGFPTKLGEYLATGKPVVVTKVGEIPLYLKDGENAFLAEPDSAESFAAKLDEALSDPEKANKIGLAGRNVALSVFDYRVQSKRMIEFLETLKKK